jgi:hypothetical protein
MKKAAVSATMFVGYCVGNIIGPLLFGALPGPGCHVGFLGSFVCLWVVDGTAALTVVLLHMGNRKRNWMTGALPLGTYKVEDDLTDKENKDFRYLLYRFASPSPKVKFNEQNLVSLFVASVYVHEADIYLVL